MYPPVTQFETRQLELERRLAARRTTPRASRRSAVSAPGGSARQTPRVTRLVRAWLAPSA